MKNLVHQLRARVRWAATHDDDALPGVYAVPGPRAQGDEAATEPALAAELLDEIRLSQLPDESASTEACSTPPDDPEPGAN